MIGYDQEHVINLKNLKTLLKPLVNTTSHPRQEVNIVRHGKLMKRLVVSSLTALLLLITSSQTALALPAAPTLVFPTNGTTITTQPTFDWDDVITSPTPPANEWYQLKVANTSTLTNPVTVKVTASNYTFPLTFPTGQWWWQVQATDDNGTTFSSSPIWTFTIRLANISVSPYSGQRGTSFTVSGTGWQTGETVTIYYDGTLQQTLSSVSTNWTATLTRTGVAGYHTITVIGTTSGTKTTSIIVTSPPPSISLSQTSASPNTTVSVTGTDFAPAETVYVTLDGSVMSNTTSDTNGSWTLSFEIPKKAKGTYTVDAYGGTTLAAEVPDLSLQVVPSMSLSPTSTGPNGVIVIEGYGFGSSSSVEVICNNKVTAFITDTNGTLTGTINAPAIGGNYTVTVDGLSGSITVSRSISTSLAGGAIGSDVVITGSGLSESVATLIYDDIVVGTANVKADGKLNFTFKVPKSSAGTHTIQVVDSAGNILGEVFNVESNAPIAPQLLKPEAGSREGWSKANVTFAWSEVTDPSGVSYNLQVAADQQMTNIITNIAELLETAYQVQFGQGAYFWWVQAEDGAGNKSNWAAVSNFVIAYPVPLWVMVIIPLIFLGFTGGVVYLIWTRKIRQDAELDV